MRRKVTQAMIIERFCNAIEFAGIILVLLAASIVQFVFNEEPCPLCLLQRLGLFCVAFGFLLNLRFGLHLRHYAIIILSALFTAFVALRQIAVNLHSSKGGFGTPVLGFHLYTWVFIIAMLILIVTTIVMSMDRKAHPLKEHKQLDTFTQSMFALTVLLLAINIVTAIKVALI